MPRKCFLPPFPLEKECFYLINFSNLVPIPLKYFLALETIMVIVLENSIGIILVSLRK